MNVDDLATVAELALLFGVHRHTVDTWVKDGLPATRTGAVGSAMLAPVKDAVRWVRENDAARAKAALERARQEADGEETSKARKLAADARMRELDLAEREGKLVDVAQVEDAWQQQVAAVREALLTLAGEAVQAGLVRPSEGRWRGCAGGWCRRPVRMGMAGPGWNSGA
jgi:phage terminase Nu1 subunit (DNA packaging protein)